MNFRDWLKIDESSVLNKRFSHLGDFTPIRQKDGTVKQQDYLGSQQNIDRAYQSKKEARGDMKQAAAHAQAKNKEAGGRATVYYSMSEPKRYSLDQSFAYLTGGGPKEMSVSVDKGVWNTMMVVEGKAKLLMYYTKDISTNATPDGQMIPIASKAPEDHSHYDEGVIRLADVIWTKIYIDDSHPDIDKFGGVKAIAELAKKYKLQLARSPEASSNSAIGRTNTRQQTVGRVAKDT